MLKARRPGRLELLGWSLTILLVLAGCGLPFRSDETPASASQEEDTSAPSSVTDVTEEDEATGAEDSKSTPVSDFTPTPEILPTSTVVSTPEAGSGQSQSTNPSSRSISGIQAGLAASVTAGQAPLIVQFTNLSSNADNFRWDFGDGETDATNLVDEVVSHQYVKAGTYEVALAVAKNGDDHSIALAAIKVVVEPGLLHRIVLEPSNPSVMAADQEQFTVTAFDRFGNIILGLASNLSVSEIVGQIRADGVFTAGTKAAHYEAAVTAVVTQGPATKTATVDVTVEDLNDARNF